MTRRCVAFVLCCLCLAAQTAWAVTPFEVQQGSQLAAIVKRGKLVVGMELKYPPFEYVDEKGQPRGFDVDLARLAARDLGVELEIKDMEWTGLIPALQAGKIDCIVSGISGTPERSKSVTFTAPYFTTGLCVLASTKRAPGLENAEQLNAPGRILAVKTGTTADTVAGKRFPKATINRFRDETACVQEVVNGRADAFLYDQLSIAKHHKQYPAETRALLTPFTYEGFCIALRKGDFDWWQWLQFFLDTHKADGRLEALRKTHMGELLP
ncbi:transporter substrate-binding domain-containing protein [Fundidesulfovibrio butyratiphilus]